MKTDKELTYDTFRPVLLKSTGIKKNRGGGMVEKIIGNLLLHISNIVDNSLNCPPSYFKPSFLSFLCKISSICISYFVKSFIFHDILRSV